MWGLKGAASASMLAARAPRHAGELAAELGWPLGPGCEPAQSDCSISFSLMFVPSSGCCCCFSPGCYPLHCGPSHGGYVLDSLGRLNSPFRKRCGVGRLVEAALKGKLDASARHGAGMRSQPRARCGRQSERPSATMMPHSHSHCVRLVYIVCFVSCRGSGSEGCRAQVCGVANDGSTYMYAFLCAHWGF